MAASLNNVKEVLKIFEKLGMRNDKDGNILSKAAAATAPTATQVEEGK